MNKPNGQEIYYKSTHESQRGILYCIVMLIPWQDQSPQPPEIWIRNEGSKETKVFVSVSSDHCTWIDSKQNYQDPHNTRLQDILSTTLQLDIPTCSFLFTTWKGVFSKWKTNHEENGKSIKDSEKLSRRFQPEQIVQFK